MRNESFRGLHIRRFYLYKESRCVLPIACVLLLGSYFAYNFRFGSNPLFISQSDLTPIPDVIKNGRYLVYECSRAGCGGWADHLEGITSVYLIALATNRRFLINMTYPFQIKGFLNPNEVDWTIDPEAMKNKSSRLYSYIDNRNFVRSLQNTDFDSRHPEDIVRLKMNFLNWHYISKNVKYQARLGELCHQSLGSSFATIHRRLFSFSDELKLRLSALRTQVGARSTGANKLVCAHIRTGIFPTDLSRVIDPEVFWTFLDGIKTDDSRIFVSSDSPDIVNSALRRYDWQAVSVPGPLEHIDRSKQKTFDGFWKVLTDFYALMMCDILVLSSGSFGLLPAFIRGRDDGLYILRNHNIIKVNLTYLEWATLKLIS